MRLMAASKVFVGFEAPAAEVAEKRLSQGVKPAGEEVQVWRRLARVLTFGAVDVPVLGKVAPGEVPVVRLTRLATVAKALVSPVVLLAEAPRLVLAVRN